MCRRGGYGGYLGTVVQMALDNYTRSVDQIVVLSGGLGNEQCTAC